MGRKQTSSTKKKTSESLKKWHSEQVIIREQIYLKHPKCCMICQSSIPYQRRKRKTCSIHCQHSAFICSGQKAGLVSAASRPKRSKNEIIFAELCKNHFSKVTTNDPIFDGWDADVLVHDHKIAVLWNGDWHYREMNCYNHSLQQVQNRDEYKLKLIVQKEWIAYVIKDTTDHPTKPDDAFEEFLHWLGNGRNG
jgi:hypothetical protein